MNDDHYMSAVESFVSKQNGGDLTPHIVYEFVKALNADNRDRHEETMGEIAKLTAVVGGRAEAIERAKAEVMHEVETREHWPVLDAALEKLCAEMDLRAAHRSSDPEGSDWTGERGGRLESADEAESSRQRFTKEQIVSAVIIFLATIATNAAVVWIIVKSLEGVTK